MHLGLHLGLSRRGGASEPPLAPYTGIVARGTFVPNQLWGSAGAVGLNTYAPLWSGPGGLSSFQLMFGNWMANLNGGSLCVENTTGCVALNMTCVIEYPAGVYTRVQKSASNTIPLAINADVTTDTISVSIPANTKFMVHCYWSKQGGGDVVVPGSFSIGDGAVHGGGYALAATPNDTTGTLSRLNHVGSIGSPDYLFAPLIVIGTTTRRGFALLGDSRTYGSEDRISQTTNGANGELGRVLVNAGYAYANLGTGNDEADEYIASRTHRQALANYATDIVLGFGANDIFTAKGSQIATDSLAIAALFPTARIFYYTIPPVGVVSSDNMATLANQTVNGVNNERKALNSYIRYGLPGQTRSFEVADLVEPSRDSGKWRVDQGMITGDGVTYDSTHESYIGNELIASSGSFNFSSTATDPPVSALDPATLFGSGQKGGWWFVSPAYCWQDTAGTTPCVVGDPVGRIDDRSGNGNHLLQATAGKRPILRQQLGQYYLEFDGVDDMLISAAFGSAVAAPYTWALGFRETASATFQQIIDGVSNRSGFADDGGAGNSFSAFAGGASTDFLCKFDRRDAVVLMKINGASSTAQADNETQATGNIGSNSLDAITLGARNDQLFPATMRFFGMIVRDNLSDSDAALVRTYLLHRQGRVL